MKQFESGFKKTINWNKCQSKLADYEQNRYFYYLIDASFQGLNRLFVFSFENRTDRNINTGNYITKVKIKDCNINIDRKNFCDQSSKNDSNTYDNIRKIAVGQEDNYAIGCLLDYSYL